MFVYGIRALLTLLILLVIALWGASLQCEAVPLCNSEQWLKGEEIPIEQREVTIRVPDTYPGNTCGLICGSPEEKLWWESQKHVTLPKWSERIFPILLIIGVYLLVLALEYATKKIYHHIRH